jgi:hypothetical protein
MHKIVLLPDWVTWQNCLGVVFLVFAFFMLTVLKAKNLRDRRKKLE